MSAGASNLPHIPDSAIAGPMRNPPEAERIEALDALRGIAILFVIIGHYLPFNLVRGEVALQISTFAQGGVILFFTLSGFLIERNLARNDNLTRYALHRFFRIVPAYWAALSVIFVLEWFLTGERPYSAREVFINTALLSDILGAALISGVFWTLLIEIKFYVAAPVLKRFGDTLTFLSPFLAIALNTAVVALRGEASNLLTYITFCLAGMQFSLQCRATISRLQLGLVMAAVVSTTFVFASHYKIGMTLVRAARLRIAMVRYR